MHMYYNAFQYSLQFVHGNVERYGQKSNADVRTELGLPAKSNCGMVKHTCANHATRGVTDAITAQCNHVYHMDDRNNEVDMDRLGLSRVVIGTEGKIMNEIRKGTFRAEDFACLLLDGAQPAHECQR